MKNLLLVAGMMVASYGFANDGCSVNGKADTTAKDQKACEKLVHDACTKASGKVEKSSWNGTAITCQTGSTATPASNTTNHAAPTTATPTPAPAAPAAEAPKH